MSERVRYFSEGRLARLQAAADAWLGTPYVQSGAVRGNGASCHRLVDAVLRDAGFPMPPVPERGTTTRSRFLDVMRGWLDGHAEHFAKIDVREVADLCAGDLLLCKVGIGHMALYLGGPAAEALQVLRTAATHKVTLHHAQTFARVLCAYRPLEVIHG